MARIKAIISKTVAALAVCGFVQVAGAGEFESPLTACLSNGTAIGGVGSCGKIWKLQSGTARRTADGKHKGPVQALGPKVDPDGESNRRP